MRGWFLRLPLALVLALAALWGSGALYYRADLPGVAKAALIALFSLLLLSQAGRLLLGRPGRKTLYLSLVALAALGGWYARLRPSDTLDWASDVARRSRVEIRGDAVLVHDLRNFAWQDENKAIERWEERRYALSELRTLDLFLSYWSGPSIAHLIASFGFTDGHQLAFSTEIRKRKGQDYDPIAGFFRSYTLAVIAAEEADVIKLRSNRRREDVYRYRLDLRPETLRLLLADYAALTQKLDQQPEFYNTLLDNCSMVPFSMVRRRDPKAIPFDWRILTVGALPEYLFEHGFLEAGASLAELRARARITAKALAAEDRADFSAAIRAP